MTWRGKKNYIELKVKTNKLPEARENAREEVVIGLSFLI